MNQFRLLLFAFLLCNLTFQSCVQSNSESTETLTLKPDAREGVDAVIWTETPDKANPNHSDFQVMGWTWYSLGFNAGIRRSLINFNLSTIPQNAEIVNATLSLYYNPSSAEIPSTFGHSKRDGTNSSLLSRITSPWSEATVTWNNQPSISTDNQIIVKESDTIDEDYTIDVKNLIEDMVKNPTESHGFLFNLENENYYRAMIFASSDNENYELHPQLEIEYKIR